MKVKPLPRTSLKALRGLFRDSTEKDLHNAAFRLLASEAALACARGWKSRSRARIAAKLANQLSPDVRFVVRRGEVSAWRVEAK